jgi:hypothetical protein
MADGEGLKAPLISRDYGYLPIDPDVRDRCHQDVGPRNILQYNVFRTLVDVEQR